MRPILYVLCATLLTSCSQMASRPVPLVPDGRTSETRSSSSSAVESLYDFTGAPDGIGPAATLLAAGGELYGTTRVGGANNLGSVFSVSTSGQESVIYSFGAPSSTDGTTPMSGLIDVNGTFYGTTANGGAGNCANPGCGTVFALSPSGTESILYSFRGGSDGAHPVGGLIDVKGTLYGTTSQGGNGHACCGTVFALTPSGAETVLVRFQGAKKDGSEPLGDLIDVKGELYGTTRYGGPAGAGTIFAVSLSGAESIVYAFKGSGADGAEPFAGLTAAGGKLVGTTRYGGGSTNCGALGCGTVFEATLAGSETVLYSFNGGTDGFAPVGKIFAQKGEFYGTTLNGGYAGCGGGVGCGTIFTLNGKGEKSLLYTFRGGKKAGAFPWAGFTALDGKLYSTTFSGGSAQSGTVFDFLP